MKVISVFTVILVIACCAWSQAETTRIFVNTACGFRAKIPAVWRIRPASKKCTLRITSLRQAPDEPLELFIHDGSLEDAAENLGFSKDSGKWMLQGEEQREAEQIETKNWIGLKGTVASRIYENGFYSGLGDQDRAVLFDRDHRVAEVTSFSMDVPKFVEGFEFLGKSQPEKGKLSER